MKLLLFLVIAILFVLITPSAFATPVEIINKDGDSVDPVLPGKERLKIPKGIAVDSFGNVYVSASNSHNVFRIDASDGKITEIINEDSFGVGTLAYPDAIAIDSNNNIYVTGSISNNVFKIETPDGCSTNVNPCTITEIINIDGDDEGNGLNGPYGIAVDSTGNVYVAGAVSHNVFRIDASDRTITEIINSNGDVEGNELDRAYGIAVDSAGNVYVGGEISDNVFKIETPDGCSTNVNPCTITEIINIDGDDEGNGLNAPFKIAVDSLGNVYVTGYLSYNVFKITPEGVKTEIINKYSFGDKLLRLPVGIAVDSSFNVYVVFSGSDNVFKITRGGFIAKIIDKTGDGLPSAPHPQRLDGPWAIAIDSSGNNVYVTGSKVPHNAFKITIDEPSSPSVLLTKSKSSNCIDCIPPTLGLNIHGKNMVDDGFSFNGNYTNVQYLHTPFPLISTEVGVSNTMTMKIFENHGINDLTNVRVGLGMESIGTPIDLAEVVLDIQFTNRNVTDIEIMDQQFLIQDVAASSEVVKCKESSNDKKCLKVKLTYSYRESPMYNIVAVSPVDYNANSWPFYFNDGIKVDGMSLNEPATVIASGDLYTQLDKWQDIWVDNDGIKYQRNMAGQMVRITEWPEIQCNDTPLSEITGGVGRENCHFRALTPLW